MSAASRSLSVPPASRHAPARLAGAAAEGGGDGGGDSSSGGRADGGAPRGRLRFAFDVVCPYAYLASRRVAEVAARSGAELEWFPVLLGGLYKNTDAPQGKDGSASDVMPEPKRASAARDLLLEAGRQGAPLRLHARHPLRTLYAMRLLAAAPAATRAALAAALYEAYMVRGEDVDSPEVVAAMARRFGLPADAASSAAAKEALTRNTAWASEQGAFGVPASFVSRDGGASWALFWGQDRLPLVERALGGRDAKLLRLAPALPAGRRPRPVRFYFDFSSPWAFIGYTQLKQLRATGAEVTLVPILLGAVFKSVGTPIVPLLGLSPVKQRYMMQDMRHWLEWWGESLRYPDKFPIRSVLPLRVFLVEPRVLDCVYRGAWQRNVDIGDEAALRALLDAAGFDGAALIAAAQGEAPREQLRRNTEEAVARGVFGVPTYEVVLDGAAAAANGGGAGGAGGDEARCVRLWGQDRIGVVLDLICGWRPGGATTPRL